MDPLDSRHALATATTDDDTITLTRLLLIGAPAGCNGFTTNTTFRLAQALDASKSLSPSSLSFFETIDCFIRSFVRSLDLW